MSRKSPSTLVRNVDTPHPGRRKAATNGEDPYAAVTARAKLRHFKPRKAKARMKRVGIVPVAPDSRHMEETGSSVRSASYDLLFPPNNGVTDTNVVNHGGAIAPGVPVELVFWGSAWDTPANSAIRAQLVAAATGLIAGPYFSALKEYGISAPTFRGAITLESPGPPASFDDGDVGDALWNMIDANVFPEPDDSGGRNAYCFFM